MEKFRRFGYQSIIPMTIFLPLWITFGRGALGSAGWLELIYIIELAPILIIAMIVIAILIRRRRDVRDIKLVSNIDAWLLLSLYASVFINGFFIVDGGDTQDSIGSVATRIVGIWFEPVSSLIALAAGYIAAASLAALIIVAIVEIYRGRRKPNAVGINT